MPRSHRSQDLWNAFKITAMVFFLFLIVPLPNDFKGIVVAILTTFWFCVGVAWVNRNGGKGPAVVISLIPALLAGWFAIEYWRDLPNRELAAAITACRAAAVTSGTYLTGKLERVHFYDDANDADVKRFVEIKGLEHLELLSFNGTRMTDETAKLLSRFSKLRDL